MHASRAPTLRLRLSPGCNAVVNWQKCPAEACNLLAKIWLRPRHHALRRIPLLLVFSRGLLRLLGSARKPVAQNLAAHLQLHLLRGVGLEIPLPAHWVERARLLRWHDAGANEKSGRAARLAD